MKKNTLAKISSIVLVLALFSAETWAATHQIKINSWRRININEVNDTAAEVCGHVTGALTGQERVLLTSDKNADSAEYTTLLSPNGNFCQVVNSYTGQIQADLLNATAAAQAKAAL